MNDNDSICEFFSTKQMEFNEACCAFAWHENMTLLAEKMGMSPTMLRNKLNPDQPHVLSCPELITLSKLSGNYSVVNCLLLGLDLVTAPIPVGGGEASFIQRALDSSIHSGELSRLALKYAGQQRLSRTEKHSIVQTAQASISSHVLLINSLGKRNQSATLRFEREGGVSGGVGLCADHKE
ncbi:phage regulatory CII family protein [Vibrio neptunius]|uniref:Phage regulatory CII family protein n=1 Tax=Vibrio neptunius TaxID=170651 RepID=A0ABS3A9G3_9VIBR|nr:phage regulatory CII family protein [Vibrio neptunius]MBN3495727.1 phage regulatory CII family protein [Vibrio neptunius]MBN3518151.1 phage regulatory CII family protein [Vibrio neptunius]MBN3552506.1 phage regulatory CII family protein [Vibrio neptunius]MBN3580546.1 phage regulatory CII family protein [Vibrio neptunius]MCH9874213.1 phage regulatory CII family protein [Vibrio neptunius]